MEIGFVVSEFVCWPVETARIKVNTLYNRGRIGASKWNAAFKIEGGS